MTAKADTEPPVAQKAALPVDCFRDAVPYLRRPFTPAAVKFKVQSTWESGGLIVAYIDARLVVERLNLIVPHLWSDAYRPISGNQMWCDLTVDGITRSDVGEGAGKGLVSDALKRAAVRFGIGVSLYATPSLILDNKHLRRKGRVGGKETVTLNDEGLRFVRATYETWLDQYGIASFGEPFDHGDVLDAQGDPEADEELSDRAAAILPPPLTDDRAKKLKQEIREVYKQIKAIDPMELPPGRFNVKLSRAEHEHERLQELLAELQSQLGHMQAKAGGGAEEGVRTPERGAAK